MHFSHANNVEFCRFFKCKIVFGDLLHSSQFINSMIQKNDLDSRKILINCIPYAGQQNAIKIVADLFLCINNLNTGKCKQITIFGTNQLSNDEIYNWLKSYSSQVIFYRHQIDGKLTNKVVAYIMAEVIPSGFLKVSSYKYVSVL